MKTVKISLNSIDKVKSFVNDITKFDYDFDLVSGRYVIDAKSIMGIFSLDLSKPIDLNIHADDNVDEIMAMLKPYLCDLFVIKVNDLLRKRADLFKGSALFFYFTSMTSTVSIACFISSSIFSFRFSSERRITSIFGFVTGCFATKIVQQSSYGRMEVS